MQGAVESFCSLIGLFPRSGSIPPNAKSYLLSCAGELPNGEAVLVRANCILEVQTGIRVNVTCKSCEPSICESMIASLDSYLHRAS